MDKHILRRRVPSIERVEELTYHVWLRLTQGVKKERFVKEVNNEDNVQIFGKCVFTI